MARSLRGHLAVERVSGNFGTFFESSEFEVALDLNVHDGYVAENMKKVFPYLETKILLKFSPSSASESRLIMLEL